ncbi:hypothetical protein J6590_090764, partial [Homalodisca vitripennis]
RRDEVINNNAVNTVMNSRLAPDCGSLQGVVGNGPSGVEMWFCRRYLSSETRPVVFVSLQTGLGDIFS